MSMSFSFSSALRRTFAVAVVAGSAFSLASAQTAPATGETLFSSSIAADASQDATANTATRINLASLEKGIGLPGVNAQYGRRRYGAPRYRGANTNGDGSEKYTVYAGGGFNSPVGNQFNYATTGWGAQVGAGRNFNKRVGVNLEFDYDHFGMTTGTLNNQQTLYNIFIAQSNQNQSVANQVPLISGLGGNNHVWSISVDPTFTFHQSEKVGAYLIGGAGFYHKVANFTLPQQGTYCDYYGFCYSYVSNQVIDHYTSNAPGFNGGIGFTYKFSRFANERFYGEVRYVYVLNSARPGITLATIASSNPNANIYNDFPQNSNRTPYLPVKFGIRF